MHNKKYNNKNNNFIQGLRPFANTIPRGLKKILKKGGYNFSNIVDNWTKMMGKDISDSCYPNTIKIGEKMNNGTLVINVIHGKELDVEYKKNEIINKINSFFGYSCISEIRLKVIQEKNSSKEKNLEFKCIKKNFENKLNTVNNESLKKSLNQLVEAFNDKKY
jgi:hypothetical protein